MFKEYLSGLEIDRDECKTRPAVSKDSDKETINVGEQNILNMIVKTKHNHVGEKIKQWTQKRMI
jgi:hypothetical protein